MMSPISENLCSATRTDRGLAVRSGFTLVELLVVIGIVALLLGILIPTVSIALKHAKKARIAASLQTISTALEAYKRDFGDYPRLSAIPNPVDTFSSTPYAPTGSQLLTLALIGPDAIGTTTLASDSKKGPGFRAANAGRTYGPYLKPDSFKFSDGTNQYVTPLDQTLPPGCLLDGYGNPILYYPAALSRIKLTGGYVGQWNYSGSSTVLYNYNDNDMSTAIPNYPFTGIDMMRIMLGGWDGDAIPTEDSETTLYTGPFLLWSAGPDGFFGPEDENGKQLPSGAITDDEFTKGKQAAQRSDDVTNFPR